MIILSDGDAAHDRLECRVVDAASSALQVHDPILAAVCRVAHVKPGVLAAAEGLVSLQLFEPDTRRL